MEASPFVHPELIPMEPVGSYTDKSSTALCSSLEDRNVCASSTYNCRVLFAVSLQFVPIKCYLHVL